MHIVIDARMIDASGIGVYLTNVLINLGDEYQLTLLGDPSKLAFYKFKAKIIPFFAPIYSIKEQITLIKYVPECDIFWSPHYNVPLLPVKAKQRLVTIHDVCHLALGDQLSFIKRLYAKIVTNAAVRLSDEIITVSEFSKSEIMKYTRCKYEKIRVIPNGVKQFSKFQHLNDVRIKYNLPVNYILYVGNVKPHKNLKKFLESYLLLEESIRHQYKIVIVGKKDGFITGDEALFTWISQTPGLIDRILFTGFVVDEDMDTIYHLATAFVFPTIYEGFGLPPLEAMVNECPVAVSDQSSVPEVCGKAALYFNPFDVQDMSYKITQILTDSSLKKQLIERGKTHVQMYNWSNSAQLHKIAINNMYNKL